MLARNIKARYITSKINSLVHPITKVTVTNPLDITNAFCNYYHALYNLHDDPESPQPSVGMISDFFKSVNLPSISPDQLEQISAQISTKEVMNTTRSLSTQKSLGIDEYVNEYYTMFCEILAPTLAEVFNTAAVQSSFPPEMLQAVVVTLPKPGKDPTKPGQFHY